MAPSSRADEMAFNSMTNRHWTGGDGVITESNVDVVVHIDNMF